MHARTQTPLQLALGASRGDVAAFLLPLTQLSKVRARQPTGVGVAAPLISPPGGGPAQAAE